jgi:hypothetical protein
MTHIKASNFEVKCPHCDDYIIIEQINCAIFRHGVLKSNLTQINPHLAKSECDRLKESDLIYGCGKPFKVIFSNNEWCGIICEYI